MLEIINSQENPFKTVLRSQLSRDEYDGREFPCVQKGDLYLVWVEERREWVGIHIVREEHIFDYPFSEHPVHALGPYSLNLQCGQAIQEAYSLQDINFAEILTTSPSELEQLVNSKS